MPPTKKVDGFSKNGVKTVKNCKKGAVTPASGVK